MPRGYYLISADTQSLRHQVLQKYGGRCVCPCGCGDANVRHLTFDHVLEDEGTKERQSIRGAKWYLKLLAQPVSPRLRLLCANCHWERSLFGKCEGRPDEAPLLQPSLDVDTLTPEDTIRIAEAMSGDRIRQLIAQRYEDRRVAILVYGGEDPQCACCGSRRTLQIDHVFGDGKAHRQELAGKRLETWLREQNFPPGFQLLCARCNINKGIGPACQIDHSKEIIIDDKDLPMHSRRELSKAIDRENGEGEHEDNLVLLSTRVPEPIKQLLQQEADARRVSMGVIISERMTDTQLITRLQRIEQKLDRLEQERPSVEARTPPLAQEPRQEVELADEARREEELARYLARQQESVPRRKGGTLWSWFRR
jgi:hypothetical protein